MPSKSHHVSPHLASWYNQKNGPYLLASLRNTLQPVLDTSFGYHILQMGVTSGCKLYDHSRINHRIYSADHAGQGISLVADSDELPLESNSIDTIIAHHSLEFSPNPHGVLREIQRVLAPQGHILVIGFNPYSLLGGRIFFGRICRNPLWQQQQLVSKRRLTDWLHLLGCEVQSSNYIYSLPPVGGKMLQNWLTRGDSWSNKHNLPSGGLYVIHAIKQVSALNEPRMRLRERGERLIDLAVPKPNIAPSPTPAVAGSGCLLKEPGEVAA